MPYYRKLGIFVKTPIAGEVKTRLVPPLTREGACELYEAFLRDLFTRLTKLKKVAATVFYSGSDPTSIRHMLPKRHQLVPQNGETLGERLENAFRLLLEEEGSVACIIGSDSPDIPLTYIKRAYLKLKHKDVVVGPSFDGGYYLIALKKIFPELFRAIAWSEDSVLGDTLQKIEADGLSCASLPLWYDVDDERSLSTLKNICHAKRVERSDRLQHTERVLEKLFERKA